VSNVVILESARRDQVLRDAVARNTAAVLSLKNGHAWSVHKSRLLGASATLDAIVVEYPAPTSPSSAPPEVAPGESCSVAFRRGHKKCIFTSRIIGRRAYALNQQVTVDALVLSWPETLQGLQRRAYYRAPVPRHRTVIVECWQGGARNRSKAGTVVWPSYHGRLVDLSAGGMRVALSGGRDPGFHVGDLLGIQFQPDSSMEPLVLDAILRHSQPRKPDAVHLGLQFVGLEMTVEGRRLLTHILRVVSEYPRYELRHSRLVVPED